jgi:hypothetical protein
MEASQAANFWAEEQKQDLWNVMLNNINSWFSIVK